MRKWISLILCLTMIVTLAGCGNNNTSGKAGSQPAGVNENAPEPDPIDESEIASNSTEV